MELQTAIEILEYHQEWRLGKREDMIHEPKKLTEALDIVLNEVKKFRIAVICHHEEIIMRTKEEILFSLYKSKFSDRIFRFQKLVNHDLIYNAMQQYAEEYHQSELLKLNKSDVISSVCDCNNRKPVWITKRNTQMCGNCHREIAN